MKERLVHFLKSERLTSSDLAEKIGVQPSTISHILSGRNNPSYEFIERFLKEFPHVNAEWLITGSGNMYKSEVGKDVGAGIKEPVLPLPGNQHEKTVEMAPPQEMKQFRVEKIIVFYQDNTYQEFFTPES